MTTTTNNLKSPNNDFGFTALSFDDLVNDNYDQFGMLRELHDDIATKKKAIQQYQKKLQKIHSIVMPLINNLLRDPEKDFIHWPSRTESVKQLAAALNQELADAANIEVGK